MTTVADAPDRWPVPLSEPPAAPPGPPEPPTVRIEVPGVEDVLLVGPRDVVVFRVPTTVLSTDLQRMAENLEVGPLAGRVLLVAAADGYTMRA